jgi:hypothetical protein
MQLVQVLSMSLHVYTPFKYHLRYSLSSLMMLCLRSMAQGIFELNTDYRLKRKRNLYKKRKRHSFFFFTFHSVSTLISLSLS